MSRLGSTLVLVVWHDAHSCEGWSELSDVDNEPYDVQTVGFMIPNAKAGHVVLAQSIGPDDALDGILQIPAGMVVSCTVLGNPQVIHTD